MHLLVLHLMSTDNIRSCKRLRVLQIYSGIITVKKKKSAAILNSITYESPF